MVIRSSGDTGQLYGSVTPRDIAELLSGGGFDTARNQVVLSQPIKTLGLHTVAVNLHPEVTSSVIVNVARTEEEAERQAAGADVTSEAQSDEEEAMDLDAIFEEGASADIAEEEAEDTAEEEAADEAPADEEPAEEPAEEEDTSKE